MSSYLIARNGGVFLPLGDGRYERYSDKQIYQLSDEDIVRTICSKQEIEDILERIEFIRTMKAPSLKIYKEFYDEAMEKYDEEQWVKVVKTAYTRERIMKADRFEKEISLKAKEYLYSEMSILLDIPYQNVEAYIENYIKENSWDE